MRAPNGSRGLRALSVSIFTAIILAVVPLYGLGHVHPTPELAQFDDAGSTHASYGSCLICRLAHERAIDGSESPSVGSPVPTGATIITASSGTRRGAAGPLTSRGPPPLS